MTAWSTDSVDGRCLDCQKVEHLKIPGQFLSIEAMVHDPIGIVLVKRTVFFIEVGEGKDATRFQTGT